MHRTYLAGLSTQGTFLVFESAGTVQNARMPTVAKKKAPKLTQSPRASNAAAVAKYFNAAPVKHRALLLGVSAMIKKLVPGVNEKIGYGIPVYSTEHGMIMGLGSWAKHCAVYGMNDSLTSQFARELTGFETSRGTIRFTVEKPIPAPLLKKMILARVAQAEERTALKGLKALQRKNKTR